MWKQEIDLGIIEYIQRFEEFYNHKVEYSVTFVDAMENNVVGVCYYWSNGGRSVKISKEFWALSHDLERESLIFHELGHCSLNRDHTTETIAYNNYSVPRSIMYPYIFGGSHYYEERRDEYIQELFSGTSLKRSIANIDRVIYN
ncbi:MAG: hypothetical protein HC836_45145 [Richelia sp. RM2_1_2]|nr:hypothetical protein [Richelia sp. RM2_1_2]